MNSTQYIFDPLRQKKVAFTPEEEVRQKVIAWLHTQHQIPYSRMASEVYLGKYDPLSSDRADLILYNQFLKPCILVECKRPQLLSKKGELEKATEQLNRYLRLLDIKGVILCDGNFLKIFKKEFIENKTVWMESDELPTLDSPNSIKPCAP